MNSTTANTFQENEHHSVPKKETMNGNRPSPLKINRDSYIIHKQQPSSSSNSRMAGYHKPQQQRQNPVIIYTHSPKVIHTRPHDFMALVQKLTGLSRSSDEERVGEDDQAYNEAAAPQTLGAPQVQQSKKDSNVNVNDNETSSGVTDDESNVHIGRDNTSSDFKASSPASRFTGFSPMQQQNQQHPYFADIPMFTPTSTDRHHFLSSPRPLYIFSDSGSIASPSTLYGSISPSVFKFIKGLPEY